VPNLHHPTSLYTRHVHGDGHITAAEYRGVQNALGNGMFESQAATELTDFDETGE
jgi:hypothetical protein